jgi:hypothetical protein
MNIRLQRLQSYSDYTIGALYIDGALACFCLEDENRNVKVWGETRIPSGVYKLRLQTAGKMHNQYSSLFSFHQGMLHVTNVPNFEGIFIHIGNTDDDTAGCLLLGDTHEIGRNFIGNSTKAYKRIYPIIAQTLALGQVVNIQVVDELRG